jgi:hypothetical protein
MTANRLNSNFRGTTKAAWSGAVTIKAENALPPPVVNPAADTDSGDALMALAVDDDRNGAIALQCPA